MCCFEPSDVAIRMPAAGQCRMNSIRLMAMRSDAANA
ncbi:hypothetical protein RS9917_11051 [Synechococcus sp. RS9917]|nr:hypothetical protein RS9917_11051 [Synechococcus sp. RS9917]